MNVGAQCQECIVARQVRPELIFDPLKAHEHGAVNAETVGELGVEDLGGSRSSGQDHGGAYRET